MNSNEELSAIGVASPAPANPHHGNLPSPGDGLPLTVTGMVTASTVTPGTHYDSDGIGRSEIVRPACQWGMGNIVTVTVSVPGSGGLSAAKSRSPTRSPQSSSCPPRPASQLPAPGREVNGP